MSFDRCRWSFWVWRSCCWPDCTAAVLVWRLPFEQVMYPTHFRIDALMCGVTIAYFFHYRRSSLDAALSLPRVRRGLVAVAVVCLLPVVTIPPDAPFILTAGLSLAYLGYAAILLLTLPGGSPPRERDGWLGPVWNGAAYIGRYSYSIYIWHVPILLWVVVPILGSRLPLWQQGFGPVVPAFVAVCICGGIAMGKLIEMPTLALRDRRFPRTAVAVPALPSVGAASLCRGAALRNISRSRGTARLIAPADRVRPCQPPSERAQTLGGRAERLVLLGETESQRWWRRLLVQERRGRDRRDAVLFRESHREVPVGLARDRGIVEQLKVRAA